VKKKRILILVHLDLVPPENTTLDESERDKSPFVTEYDVIHGLKKDGHDVKVLGIYDDLKPILATEFFLRARHLKW
jgi:D-alanine-D-alanine ligase